MSDILNMNVKIYPELLKYKDNFGNAIKIYHDKVMVGEDYSNYVSDSSKVSCRLKCEYKPDYYKQLLNTVKSTIKSKIGGEHTNKVSDTVLMNNVLASLKDNSYFN